MTPYAILLEPSQQPHPLDWMADNINYDLVPLYVNMTGGMFNPDLMPYWRQPLADSVDPTLHETVIAKGSEVGGTEVFGLGRLRFGLVNCPEPTMVVTADMSTAERFMENRWKRGMGLCKEMAAKFRAARSREYEITFEDMDFRISWSKAGSTYKQDAYGLILADEFSTWPSFGAAMLRKRCDIFPFYHILYISSLDPRRKGNPENDPTLVMIAGTNQCKWFMPDPDKKRTTFIWQMGDGKTHGLMWPKEAKRDDEWDLDMVRDKALFITPSGARITEDMRLDIMRAGDWKPTAKAKRSDSTGYFVPSALADTNAGQLGELAARFLEAKYNLKRDGTKAEKLHNSIRIYMAEYWHEAHRETTVGARDNSLEEREADYEIGVPYVPADSDHGLYMTVDVQKYHFWHNSRVWSKGRKTGKITSALLEFGTEPTLADVEKRMLDMNPIRVGFDIGYALRQTEIADFCAGYTDQSDPYEACVLALRGSPRPMANATDVLVRDALEGKKAHGDSNYLELTFDPDVFRTWFIECLNGDAEFDWVVPSYHGDESYWLTYVKHLFSTSKRDGEWVVARHGQDHQFDCECMQLVLARRGGLI